MLKLSMGAAALLILAGCVSSNPEPKVITQTKVIKQNVSIANRPDPVSLRNVKFYVVNEGNFEQFKSDFLAVNPRFVFVAVSIPDYKDLSLNLADLQRYIAQQGELIVYYESAVR